MSTIKAEEVAVGMRLLDVPHPDGIVVTDIDWKDYGDSLQLIVTDQDGTNWSFWDDDTFKVDAA
jgi:hypothetical protein